MRAGQRPQRMWSEECSMCSIREADQRKIKLIKVRLLSGYSLDIFFGDSTRTKQTFYFLFPLFSHPITSLF